MKNDLSALAEQITDALQAFTGEASKQARRGVKQARANADSLMSDVSDRGSAAYNSAYDAAHDAAYSMEESLEDVIHQRPLAAVGLALGVGLLIGTMWRR